MLEVFLTEERRRFQQEVQDLVKSVPRQLILDMDAGGEIAGNLRKLYVFMINRLSQANVQSDPQLIRDVIKLMEDLNSSWKAIT